MLSEKHIEIAEEAIEIFTSFGQFSVASINEGSCEEFAEYLNGEYGRAGIGMHQLISIMDFLSPNDESELSCEDLANWQEGKMEVFGIPSDYFENYRQQVVSRDSRKMVAYHMWLFDGENHYDATCLEGAKNPLQMPFFRLFTREKEEN